MDIEELLSLLDLDSPEELVYFEQFAELMEEPQDIPQETLSALVQGMDPDVLSELLGGYFDDILKFVPEGEDDLYTLLSNIGTTLGTLAGSGEEDAAFLFAEELYKFRSWYLFDHNVSCTNLADGSEREVALIEALTDSRAQSFGDGAEFSFDFSGALDYPLEEYIVSFSSLIDKDFDDDDYDEDDDEDDIDYYSDDEDEDDVDYYLEDSDN